MRGSGWASMSVPPRGDRKGWYLDRHRRQPMLHTDLLRRATECQTDELGEVEDRNLSGRSVLLVPDVQQVEVRLAHGAHGHYAVCSPFPCPTEQFFAELAGDLGECRHEHSPAAPHLGWIVDRRGPEGGEQPLHRGGQLGVLVESRVRPYDLAPVVAGGAESRDPVGFSQ